MDSFCRRSIPAGRRSTSILSTNPKGYSLRPVSGTYFFASASFNTGTHPLFSGLHDPDDIALPPQMIRWPQESPAVLPVALATHSQRNPVPPWLPADSKTLYLQGLEALTTEDANPAHWLPAYCSPVPLASMIARTLSFQATARLLSRPSLRATSAANSRSNNSRPSLSPSKRKMTRNWMSLLWRAVE